MSIERLERGVVLVVALVILLLQTDGVDDVASSVESHLSKRAQLN